MSAPTAPNPADGRRPRAACPHCGTAVEGSTDSYCCHGCELAARIIREAGLERYYTEREQPAPRPEPVTAGWADLPVARDPDGRCETRLAIDGLRCASCVWVTENVLQRTPGVVSASISYATGRASLRWDPARIDLPALVRRIAALGYRPRPLGEESPPDRSLMLRLGVAVFAAMNIMLLAVSIYAGWWGDMAPRYAELFRWTTLVLATPVALWCAAPFFAGAWSGLRHRVLHMDLPIALAVALLYGHGLLMTLSHRDSYLDSLAMLVALLLAGRMLEARGRRRSAEAASALVGTVPRVARKVSDQPHGESGFRITEVPVATLRPGDQIDAGAGEELAADGVVTEGSGQVRMALVTGEAEPVLVGPGDRVVAGTLLLDGALTVRVEAAGSATLVQRMAAELRAAQDRGLTPTSTDRIAPWFTALTLLVAAATFVVWGLSDGTAVAVTRTVAVLVVACPCALALSHPLAAAAGLGAAARRGLLLRSADGLLRLGRVDLAGLDKTGTVTAGAVAVLEATDPVLRIAAGLERYSHHPIARAIVAEASARDIPLPQAAQIRETPGHGISGVVDGRRWRLLAGAPGMVELREEDRTGLVGTIGLGDAIRPDAADSIAALTGLGITPVLLTGDHGAVADRIAHRAGIGQVLARQDPEAKAAWVRARQAEGHRVLLAGDGLNDGPALAAADVGLAMSSGSATSLLVADGIVAGGSLRPVVAGVRAARAARRAIRRSERRSIGYNVLAIAAAAVGWINPLVAAVLMPLSSGMVIWSAARVEHAVRREEAAWTR